MDLDNKTIHTVGNEPTKNTQTKELPSGVMTDGKTGFMGEDMGPKGKMGDYSAGVSNEE